MGFFTFYRRKVITPSQYVSLNSQERLDILLEKRDSAV